MHGNHLKHMLIGGGALLGVLLVAGIPLATALPYALFLACPLMMMFMMGSMGGHEGHGGGHDEHTTAGPQRAREDALAPQPHQPKGARDATPSVSRR